MMVKTFAWAELILGILAILVPLTWCYVLPEADVNYLVWTMVGIAVIIVIVAVLALMKKTQTN
jgi:uncharacterized membrane protein